MDVRVGQPLVLIRLNGLQRSVPAGDLRLTRYASDGAVLSAVARYLDLGTPGLSRSAQVVREPTGHLTVCRKDRGWLARA